MLNLKFKLYKSDKVKRLEALCHTAGCIWNHCLALQKRYYRLYGRYISKAVMQKHIAKLRRKNLRWQKLNSQSVQEICERQDTAYMRFFKKLAKRPPKFRKARNFQSIVFKQSGYRLENNVLTVNKIGRYKFSKSRAYENIKRICVKKDSTGDFYVVLACDMNPEPYKREGNSSIGLDFGLKNYLTMSTGEIVESPLFYRQLSKKIAGANRNLSRKTSPSRNRTKAKINLAKLYRRLDCLRTNSQWQLAHDLCRKYALIAVEDLNMDGMKHLWGGKVSDLSFSCFVDILQQSAKKYDTVIQKVDRFYPSSKLCPCGYKSTGLSLKERSWICPECDTHHDRDVLAANNILGEGIRLFLRGHKTERKTALSLTEVDSQRL